MDFSYLEAFDQSFLNGVHARQVPWLTPVVGLVTHLGDRYVLAGLAVVAAGVLAARRHYRPALLLLVTTAAAFGLAYVAKEVVRRPRPDLVGAATATEAPVTYSFPSWHALGSAAIYVALALLTARRLTRAGGREAVVVAACALTLLIGASRLYLGVHYFTDVVAGWAAGLGLALLCDWMDERWTRSGVSEQV